MSHLAGSTGGTFQQRRSAIDGELSLSIEDDEHLLALVVEMRADAALRHDDAAVQKVQIRVERVMIEQTHKIQRTGAGVNRFDEPVLRRVGMGNSLRQRLARPKGTSQQREAEESRG
jgi:hypothetical protein